MAGRKIFVGSLPGGITDGQLRQEFGRFGSVEETFIKEGCDPGRQWAFVTFATPMQASAAKEASDRILQFPGSDRPCDVMLAKNQGMFGQGPTQDQGGFGGYGGGFNDASMAPKKIFVGSLPDGMPEGLLREEFSKYGMIEDLFLKPGCEPGRQWAFVSFTTPDQAKMAADASNGVLMFPGSVRPCEVTLARNQGLFGQGSLQGNAMGGAADYGPKKIFVGTLPDSINDSTLRAEFSKFGQVVDVFLKTGCEPGRQWGFVTFASSDQARLAKESCDRILMLPGAMQPCEVTMAKHQGLYGQDGMDGGQMGGKGGAPKGGFHGGGCGGCGGCGGYGDYGQVQAPPGPTKIFVGSLPDGCPESLLRAQFSQYGQITDIYLKQGCEPGRQWAFVTFANANQAQHAKDSTDRRLVMPGNDRACEVMLAKNQGKFGQNPIGGGFGGGGCMGGGDFGQPPPPNTPHPSHMGAWKQYKTAAGLPYYHNQNTGVTTWEAPPEFNACGGGGFGGGCGGGCGGYGGCGGGFGDGGCGGGYGGGGFGKGGGRFNPY